MNVSFTDCNLCPVALFKLYKDKIHPDVPFFWQRPKQGKLHYCDTYWYDKARVGHDPIENFMATLSKEAQLSKRYTNHSIRSTAMGILGNKYEGRIIIGLSGHKSENTIKQYIRTLPPETKKDMSKTLAENILVKKPNNFNFKPIKPAASATVSKPPQNAEPMIEVPLDEPENIEPQPQANVEIQLQALDDAPPDEVLINFLNAFEAQNVPNAAPPAVLNQQQPPAIAKVNNNTMNVQNVQQQVLPNGLMPAMLFPNSNVTINYNFGK